ncbi:hypothetical protein D3C72_959950 [compost metagenome]
MSFSSTLPSLPATASVSIAASMSFGAIFRLSFSVNTAFAMSSTSPPVAVAVLPTMDIMSRAVPISMPAAIRKPMAFCVLVADWLVSRLDAMISSDSLPISAFVMLAVLPISCSWYS